MMRYRVVSGALVCAFAATTAAAQNTTAATALASAPGQVRSVSAAAGVGYYYDYFLRPGRSYAALCWNEDVKGGSSGGVFQRCTVSIRNNADAEVGTPAGEGLFDEPIAVGGSWSTFTPTSMATYVVRASNASAAVGTLRIVLVETTLFSPWFFVSPAGGYESYVEIKNTTSHNFGGVSVTVRAFAPNGTAAGTPVTRAIPAGGNTYVRVGADIGATGSGGIETTHNGPPGAIVANVTTPGTATGLSFDAPCQPRMQWSLFH